MLAAAPLGSGQMKMSVVSVSGLTLGTGGQVRQAGGSDRISDVFIAPVPIQPTTNLLRVSQQCPEKAHTGREKGESTSI